MFTAHFPKLAHPQTREVISSCVYTQHVNWGGQTLFSTHCLEVFVHACMQTHMRMSDNMAGWLD